MCNNNINYDGSRIMEVTLDSFVENLSTVELFSFHKECTERIESAKKEIKMVSLILPALTAEIETRKIEYEMDRDL